MTRQRDLKRRIRERMRATGEPYTAARTAYVTAPEPKGDDVSMTEERNNQAKAAPPGTAIPVLPSRDLDRSRQFYERIGFAVRARYDDYLIMVRDTIEVHFARGDFDPSSQAQSIFVRVADATRLYEEANSAFPDIVRCGAGAITAEETARVRAQAEGTGSHARIHAIRDVEWGGRQFALIDPDNNLLQIGEAGTTS